jgi:hypothetical protein
VIKLLLLLGCDATGGCWTLKGSFLGSYAVKSANEGGAGASGIWYAGSGGGAAGTNAAGYDSRLAGSRYVDCLAWAAEDGREGNSSERRCDEVDVDWDREGRF